MIFLRFAFFCNIQCTFLRIICISMRNRLNVFSCILPWNSVFLQITQYYDGVFFVLFFFPRGVLGEILNLIESVSGGFPSYFFKISAIFYQFVLNILYYRSYEL